MKIRDNIDRSQDSKVFTLNNGTVVCTSYQEIVAAKIGNKYYKKSEFYSDTTQKHIERFLDRHTAIKKPQSFFNNL